MPALLYNKSNSFLKGGVRFCVLRIFPTCIWGKRVCGVFHAGGPEISSWSRFLPCWMPTLWTGTAGRRPVRQARSPGRGPWRLLDWFLTQLAARGLPVFAISGNHDSADRVAFGAALLETSRVYVSPVFSGAPQPSALRTSMARWMCTYCPF